MDETKPWYLSRTIWASAVTVLLSTGGVVGLPVAGVDGGALADTMVQAVTAVSGLIAIFGRFAANSRIG